MLRRVCQWVVPQMDFSRGGWWIIDDTGFPKKGKHSVGVSPPILRDAGQAGQLPGGGERVAGLRSRQRSGGRGNSISRGIGPLIRSAESRPVCPRNCASPRRRRSRGRSLRTLLDEGAPHHCVLADAGYGVDTGFRQALTDMGLEYAVGVDLGGRGLAARDRAAATQALQRHRPPASDAAADHRAPANECQGAGPVVATPSRSTRSAGAKARMNHSAGASLQCACATPVATREKLGYVRFSGCSSNGRWAMRSRANTSCPRLPEGTPINELVSAAHQRWRIERDYQDLKQDFGLGHYEGRGWRGFHHHASLSIAAYGFLMAERLIADKPVGGKKKLHRTPSACPSQGLRPPRQSCARSGTWITRSRHCGSA